MTLTVAIIEPDLGVASTVEAALTHHGYETKVLGDGDVLDFVRNAAPHLILLNVELPRGSGYSLCNRLKKQQDLKRIPIILTSARETPEAFAQHQRTPTPADAYMLKPFSVEQLVEAVHRLVQSTAESSEDGSEAGLSAAKTDDGGQSIPAADTSDPAQAAPSSSVQDSSPGSDTASAPPKPVGTPSGPPPRRGAHERAEKARTSSGPSLEELLAQSRTDPPIQSPAATAGPEAKLTFLRETLRQREQDMARARELWTAREREIAQVSEMLELRERELERARKAREDLLAQLADSEEMVSTLRLDIELHAERTERLEREKKEVIFESENVTSRLERTIAQLSQRADSLEQALFAEQALRNEEGERARHDAEELSSDLDKARATITRREAEFAEADDKARSLIATLQTRVAGLDEELESLRAQLADTQREGELLRRELTTLRADKASDDERARTLVQDLEERIRDLSADKDHVEVALTQHQRELQDRVRALGHAESKIVDLEAELADARGQVSSTSNELESAQTLAQELHNELAEARHEALELAQEKRRVEEKLQHTHMELSRSREEHRAVSSALEAAQLAAAAEKREFDSRASDYEGQVEDLEDKLRESEEHNTTLESLLKDTRQVLDERARELEQERVGRHKDVLKRDQRIGDLEGRLRSLDQSAHEAERAAKQREADLAHELDLEKARVEELDRDLHRARVKGQELEGLLEQAKTRLVELAKDLKRNEVQVARLSDELSAQREANEELGRIVEEEKDRAAFFERELDEERKNRAEEHQQHGAALDRTAQQAQERVGKLQEAVQKLRGDLGTTTTELQAARDRLARVEEKSQKLELTLEREQREKQQLYDRVALLDAEVEEAQSKSEQLADDSTRLKTALKRAQDEVLAARKEAQTVEARFRNDENTMVKRVDELKLSAQEAQSRLRDDTVRLTKERDEARTQAQDIRRKAEALMRKYKDLEASLAEQGSSADQRSQKLATELLEEKEARAREAARFKATEEKLQKQAAVAAQVAQDQSHAEVMSLKAQLKDRDDKLMRVQEEQTALRDRVKELSKVTQHASSHDPDLRGRVDHLTTKYNDVVQKLKQQAELNLKIDAAYKELADKHRRVLLMLKEKRERDVGESTVVQKTPQGID